MQTLQPGISTEKNSAGLNPNGFLVYFNTKKKKKRKKKKALNSVGQGDFSQLEPLVDDQCLVV